jgi:hypothetical protein
MLFAARLLPSAGKVTGRLFYTPAGQVLVSALFGLALATLFRRVCKDGQCRVLRAAPLADIEGRVFRAGEHCYRYTAYPVQCRGRTAGGQVVVERFRA